MEGPLVARLGRNRLSIDYLIGARVRIFGLVLGQFWAGITGFVDLLGI